MEAEQTTAVRAPRDVVPSLASKGRTDGGVQPTSVGMVVACVAAVVLAATTYLHGRLTDRWTGRVVTGELRHAAELLEASFPRSFGDWELEEELPFDPVELQAAGAVGHIARTYVNSKSKAKVSVFVVCATPADASGHTPDRCYPGAGFEIAEIERRESVPLGTGGAAEAFSGAFRKSGQTLRLYWTYGVEGRWIAPKIARIELADAKAVFKLYAIIDETSLPPGAGGRACAAFLTDAIPDLNAVLWGERRSEAASG